MRILLTGGRSPIALAIAKTFAEAGGNVVLVTRTIDQDIKRLLSDAPAIELLEADISTDRGLTTVIESTQSAGGYSGAVFVHRYRGASSPELQIDLEVLRPARILEAIVDSSIDKNLSFVFFSSPAARSTVGDATLGYHLAKASMNAAIRFFAAELGPLGVRVNGVSPGAFVEKERSKQFFKDNPAKVDWAREVTPLGRFALASEIATVATFLIGQGSSFISGQIIEVDGGLCVQDLAGLGSVLTSRAQKAEG